MPGLSAFDYPGLSLFNDGLEVSRLETLDGFWVEDISKNIITNGLVLYVPLWLRNQDTFWSADLNRISCTVTGAVWGIQGRTYAGGDDFITITNALTPLVASIAGTWFVWAKFADATPDAAMTLVSFGDTDVEEYIRIDCATDGKLRAYCVDAGAYGWSLGSNAATFADNTWGLAGLVHSGSTNTLYFNGVAVAQTYVNQTDKSDWFDDCAGLDNGFIGKLSMANLASQNMLTGVVGEVALYDRALTATEMLLFYSATKWRYS
jgi:hypothetical protein